MARPIRPPAFEAPPPPIKRRPLIFRLARPLIGAALLAFVIGLFMYVHRPYPQPAATGDYTVAGGGPLDRGSEIFTTDHAARVTLGGLYHVDLAPRSRVKIQGLPGMEEIALLDGEITCEVTNEHGDLIVKTDLGTLRGSDVQFRAAIRPDSEGENMKGKKLVVTVLAGVLSAGGTWGQKSFGAGHEQAFTDAGPVAAGQNIAVANPYAQGTLVEVVDHGLTLKSGTVTSTVRFTDTPTVKINDQPATLADLKPGMSVVIQGTSTGTLITAHITTTQPATAVTTTTGTVQLVGQDGVTVHTATANVRFIVTTTTVIRIKDALATLADVKVGMNIAVTSSDGKTAREIRAYAPSTTPPTPTPPPVATTVTGTVQTVGDDGVTLRTANANVNFTVTSATIIHIKDAVATLAEIKAGMAIAVISTDGKTAKEIRPYPASTPVPPTPPPATTTIGGTVERVGNDGITIHTATGSVNVIVTSATIIRVKDALATLADIKPGVQISVTTSDGKTAREIHAAAPNPTPPATNTTYNVTGTIAQLGVNEVTIKGTTRTLTLAITSATTIRIKDAAATFADLKVGMTIGAVSADNKTATQIIAYMPTPAGTK